MKKTIALFPLVLLANPNYNEISKAYLEKNYQKAYIKAKELCNIDCSSVDLNMLLGKSAMQLKKYDDALAAFDRVLVMDADNTEAKLQSAIVYQKTGDTTLLKLELEDLKTSGNLNQEEEQIVDLMIKNINRQDKIKKSKNTPYASVSFGYGYDSNPKKQNLKDSYIPIPQLGFNFPIEGALHEPASSILTNLNAGFKKEVNNVYDFDINLNFYNKYYIKPIEENFQNLGVFTASINNGFEISRQFKMNVLMAYDYIILKNKRYLNTFTGDISFDYFTDKNISLGLGYTINHNNYLMVDNKENDSNHHSIYAMSRLILERSMSYLKIAYDIEKTSRVKESSNNYKEYSATFGLIYLLNKQVTLKASLSYSYDIYKEKIFDNSRKDRNFRINFGAEYNMDHHNFFTADLGYDKNKSTLEYNSFDNYFINLMYKYKF